MADHERKHLLLYLLRLATRFADGIEQGFELELDEPVIA